MSKRVKYLEKEPGVFESVRRYTTADGIKLKVLLNSTNLTYSLVSDVDGKVLNEVKAKSMHEVKKGVRAQLKKLGVEFEKEKRERGPKEETTST